MASPEIGSGDDGAGDRRTDDALPVSTRPEITQAPATATVIGLVGGGLSALLGVGGGILMVPALAYLLRVRPHRAHGTSLAVMIPIAMAGVYRYYQAGNGVWGWVVPLAIGSVLGALVGGMAANALRGSMLKPLLGVLVIAGGFAMMMAGTGHVSTAAPGAGPWSIGAVGLAAGAVSGLLGMGGGVVMVPAIVFLLGQDQHTAQGVSLAVIVPASAFGTWMHARHGNIVPTLAFWLAVGGVIGALWIGAVVQGLSSALLRALFGVFLVIMGLSMATRQSPRRSA